MIKYKPQLIRVAFVIILIGFDFGIYNVWIVRRNIEAICYLFPSVSVILSMLIFDLATQICMDCIVRAPNSVM